MMYEFTRTRITSSWVLLAYSCNCSCANCSPLISQAKPVQSDLNVTVSPQAESANTPPDNASLQTSQQARSNSNDADSAGAGSSAGARLPDSFPCFPLPDDWFRPLTRGQQTDLPDATLSPISLVCLSILSLWCRINFARILT